ncbi:MAG: aldolase/citrate lyase family protein [Longimicrobiales bacterium]
MSRMSNVWKLWHRRCVSLVCALGMTACGAESEADGDSMGEVASPVEQSSLIQLWSQGTPAFGIFVPSEGERGARGPDGERLPPIHTSAGGAQHGANPILDYLFLNLEGSYNVEAVAAIAEGMASVDSPLTLLVRIPPISADGADAARSRVAEAIAAGADGIVMPHVRSPEEARQAVSFFAEYDVWSPMNPEGTVLVMLMIEDPGALEAAQEIADVQGYSVLACGIGSLSAALGDRVAGEAGNMVVLDHAIRVGLPDMITANSDDVAQRIEEGFLGLLMNGPEADAHIAVGRAAAGR